MKEKLSRKTKNGKYYIYVYMPEHPQSDVNGYIGEHRLVMEKHLGRLLTKDEVVHHKDKNPSNNNIENLQLMTKKEHERFHGKDLSEKGYAHRYKKGHISWNKHLKGIHLNPETEFKKGELIGSSHPSWKGGVQKMKNDCVHIWDGVNNRIRQPRKIYESVYGKIPKGFIIFHKDGDKHNDSIENLTAISRKELLELNNKRMVLG